MRISLITASPAGNGCIAALANIYPELTHAWAAALGASDWERVEKIQHVIDKLADIYTVAPLFVPAVKYAMSVRGLPVQPIAVQRFFRLQMSRRARLRLFSTMRDRSSKLKIFCKRFASVRF